jgi:hypothetical protein
MGFSYFIGFLGPAHIFGVLVVLFTGTLFLILRRVPAGRLGAVVEAPLFDRTAVVLCLILMWTCLVTIEFWALGSSSLVTLGDESEIAYPYYAHLARLPLWPKARFDPDVMGGADLVSLFDSSAGAMFSLEIWLVSAFGPDAAYVIHKIANSFVAVTGAFLLVNKGVKVPSSLSLLIGFFYSVSFFFVITGTFIHGLGYALIPLGLYLLVYRIDGRGYYAGCFAFGVLMSLSMSIAHSNIAFFTALFCVSMYSGALLRVRFMIGVAIVIVLVLVNWADSIYGILSFGPFTPRFQLSDAFKEQFDLPYLVNSLVSASYNNGNTLLIALLCFAVTLGRQRMTSLLLLALAPWLVAVAFSMVPFRYIGLSSLEAIDPQYLFLGASAVDVVVLGGTVALLEVDRNKTMRGWMWQRPLFLSFLVALPISAAVCYTCLNLFLIDSGHSRAVFHLANVQALAARMDGNYRVLAGPNSRTPRALFFDNALLAYGVPTWGGNFNLIDVWHHEYWRRAGIATARGQVGLTMAVTRCDEVYTLDHLDLLRVGGVRYVVGRTPIESAKLKLVSKPDELSSPMCSPSVLKRLALVLTGKANTGAFIYEVPDPLPVVYFAHAARHSEHEFNTDDFWQEVAHWGPERIVSSTSVDRERTFADDAEIVSLRRGRESYTIEARAGHEGLLVLGHPRSPFWNATIDGMRAEIIPVNGVQMAVNVPAGMHEILFTYRRWLPSDYLLQFFGKSAGVG